MASLYILNKIYKSLAPNTFIPAIRNNDIIISGISKYVVEHMLLKTEMMIYNSTSIIPLFIPSIETEPMLIIPLIFNILIAPPIIYCVPAYRTYKAFVNKKLQIINFSNE